MRMDFAELVRHAQPPVTLTHAASQWPVARHRHMFQYDISELLCTIKPLAATWVPTV